MGRCGKWVVSVSGGREPLWAPDSSELYYRDGTNFVAVPIDTSKGFTWERPEILFTDRYARAIARNYDITPDGKTFLVTEVRDDTAAGTQDQIFVVENWTQEVRGHAPRPEAN